MLALTVYGSQEHITRTRDEALAIIRGTQSPAGWPDALADAPGSCQELAGSR